MPVREGASLLLAAVVLLALLSNSAYANSSSPQDVQTGIFANGSSPNYGASTNIVTVVQNLGQQGNTTSAWIGESLSNGASIKAGYLFPNQTGQFPTGCSALGCTGTVHLTHGQAAWFWSYQPGSGQQVYTNYGPDGSAGPDGTINSYAIKANGNRWSVYFNGAQIGSATINATKSSGGQPVASVEYNGTNATGELLKVVEFTNVSYYNGTAFVPVSNGSVYTTAQSVQQSYPFGVGEIGNRTNGFVVGSNLTFTQQGEPVWSGLYTTQKQPVGPIPTPYITVTPSKGHVGTVAVISGVWFPASAIVNITYDGVEAATIPQKVVTNSTSDPLPGSFVAVFPIPQSGSGKHEIVAQVGTSNATPTTQSATATPTQGPTPSAPPPFAVAYFNVTPSLTISPTSSYWGGSVTISGSGFSALATNITLKYDGKLIAKIPVSSAFQSSFNYSLAVANTTKGVNTTPGTHTITASDGVNTESATLTVIQGMPVNVTGAGITQACSFSSFGRAVGGTFQIFPQFFGQCVTSALPFAFIGLMLSLLFVAIAYMVGEVLRVEGLKNWYKTELWEATKSLFVIAIVFSVIVILGSVAVSLVGITPQQPSGLYSNSTVAQSASLATNLGNLYAAVANQYLLPQSLAAQSAFSESLGISLAYSAIKSLQIDVYADYPILPPPYPNLVDVTFGVYKQYIYQNTVLDSGDTGGISFLTSMLSLIIVPVMLLASIQLSLLPLMAFIGLGILLPIGIVLRAFPFLRPVGGTMIALGIGISIIYPTLMLLFNIPLTNYATSFLMLQNPPNPPLPCGNIPVLWPFVSGAQAVYSYAGSPSSGPGWQDGISTIFGSFCGYSEQTNGYYLLPQAASVYPPINALTRYSFGMLLQFILFIFDLVIMVVIIESIANVLGGTIRNKLSLGKFKLA
ncbi:MAG: hypothetical protein KGH98_00875 [Candidatus Micrarchaeota archaeon]|nr:hypothetical protein [Candidatus Micrarchaeota archaeon]